MVSSEDGWDAVMTMRQSGSRQGSWWWGCNHALYQRSGKDGNYCGGENAAFSVAGILVMGHFVTFSLGDGLTWL